MVKASMVRLVLLVLWVVVLWVPALAQDRTDADGDTRPRPPRSPPPPPPPPSPPPPPPRQTTTQDETVASPPPPPPPPRTQPPPPPSSPLCAPAPCPPATPQPSSCSCAGSALGALVVGVGIGMGIMSQLQKRNREIHAVPNAGKTDNDPEPGSNALHDTERGYGDTSNPLHPDPEPRRMTLAERYGLPPSELQPQPQAEPKPKPEPEPEPVSDTGAPTREPATVVAAEDGVEDEDEDESEDADDYQDGQTHDAGEEFDVVVDVKTSDGGTSEQNFKVKTTETLGSVKRRMSLSMGLSPDQMAVLLGSGADASNDDETIGGLGLINAETRIRTPQQAGLVACQFGRAGAKGDFEDVFIELKRGSVTFRDGSRDGKVQRTASVIDCAVDVPKQARRGHENAFRVDLAVPDSLGETKYVISVDTAEEMTHWMSIFGAYTALSPEQVASVAEAAAQAAGLLTTAAENDPNQNYGEQEQALTVQGEHEGPGDEVQQERTAADDGAAEREKARIAAEEEAEREARLAVEKAEQERAQAEIARGMEAVKEATLQRSILLSRIPRCQGQVMCQLDGKKKFINVFLELADGVLRMKEGDNVLRSATVAGCGVGELKQPRKGHEYAFRVDLQDADSGGSKKYVLSLDTDEEKQLWISRLRAYTYLSVGEVAEVMQLAADVEAVASQGGARMDDYGDDT